LSHTGSDNIRRGMIVLVKGFLAKTRIPNYHAIQTPFIKRQHALASAQATTFECFLLSCA
ncbi:hypothetical protein, partial [Xenorhabdus nematophila]|uniref:hypothetical protein n=1 Tax=Xenorhabdus nematophila TaxID=628 RepID=UPI0039ECC515